MATRFLLAEHGSSPQGLLVVDKPRGPTSHDVVAQARRVYSTRRVGHAGTLDPMATGVLLLLFGEATKFSSHLTLNDKRYRARVRFGTSTDTLDAVGRVLEERELEAHWLTEPVLRQALLAETERQIQLPPDYSALKVGGRPAHVMARRGQPAKLEPRSVRVLDLELQAWNEQEVVVDLWVSKGYYVRALARDLGERLGVPAHLAELVRVASGPFTLAESVPWPPDPPRPPLPLARVVERAFTGVHLNRAGVTKAESGQRLGVDDFATDAVRLPVGELAGWLDPEGRLVALGRRADLDCFVVVRGFAR